MMIAAEEGHKEIVALLGTAAEKAAAEKAAAEKAAAEKKPYDQELARLDAPVDEPGCWVRSENFKVSTGGVLS